MHLNLKSDLTGSLVKMLSIMSCGTKFFCWRIGGFLVWNIFQAEEKKRESKVVWILRSL